MTTGSISLDFAPSATRARQLDARMRSELAASLRYLVTQLAPRLSIDPASAEALELRLTAGAVPPLLFALYSDLVFSINDDDLEEAERIWRLLIECPAQPSGLTVLELGDPQVDESAERYIRYVDTDPAMPLALRSPQPAAVQHSRAQIEAARALIAKGDPDLFGELQEILREIVLCSGSPQAEYSFDGASSFLLWGAILINADRKGDELSMVQMLAHESAHNLLFGLCPDQPLVTNGPDERYPSPLRHDPRPLDGIYHATFVSARMHRASKRLGESGILSPAQADRAKEDVLANQRAFDDGISVLDRHAQFTPDGREIIESARAYISQNRVGSSD